MENNYFRYYKKSVPVPLILIAGTLIGLALSVFFRFIDAHGVHYYQYPTTTAIVGGIIFLINKKAWRYKLFRFLFDAPVLMGRYEGSIFFVNPNTGKKETKNCAIEIIQFGDKIKLNSYFENDEAEEKTKSKSLVESIINEVDNRYSIIYTYQNLGSQTEGFPPHNGTNILTYIETDEGKALEGVYYTDRVPYQTKGEIYVKFNSNKLKHKY